MIQKRNQSHLAPRPTHANLPEAGPEPGQPTEIHHGCDYLNSPDGTLEFYYNFLDYTWHAAAQTICARCYLDERHTANFNISKVAFDMRADANILAYVQRRFRTITPLESSGYVAQLTRAHVPIQTA